MKREKQKIADCLNSLCVISLGEIAPSYEITGIEEDYLLEDDGNN